jgi:transposase
MDKALLVELYDCQKLSQREIAEQHGVSRTKVRNWMKQLGIQPRSVGEATLIRYGTGRLDKNLLFDLYYNQKKSTGEIAKECGVSKMKVQYWMKKSGIAPRSRAEAHCLRRVHPRMEKELLFDLYHNRKMSAAEIAQQLGVGERAVIYWMDKHGIARRSLSKAIYVKLNPNGDPFRFIEPRSESERELLVAGLALYLGEGTRRGKHEVALANTDPRILRMFLKFLREICGVSEDKIAAELIMFDDVSVDEAIDYWAQAVNLDESAFRHFVNQRSAKVEAEFM